MASGKSGRRRKRRKTARPPFAESFPADPALERVLSAFEGGDFARVRSEAPELARDSDDARVREAALELRRRIDFEPTAAFLWALGVALLVFLYGYHLTR
jgi:hypothetical protein